MGKQSYYQYELYWDSCRLLCISAAVPGSLVARLSVTYSVSSVLDFQLSTLSLK